MMRFLFALVSTLALTSPLVSVSAQGSGCVISTDQKCGTVCYNPVGYVCADPNTSFLCPINFPSLCGGKSCYSTSQYTCVNGQLIPGSNSTPAPTSAPGCLFPGDAKCGNLCYSPVTQVCANPATSSVCPIAEPLVCGINACYSSSQYSCVNGQLVPAGPTQGPTSPGTGTPGPTTAAPGTPAPGCVIPGDLKCGTTCFSPVTHVCADPKNSFLCPVAFPSLCGANACYSTSQYDCVNGQLQPKSK